MLNNSQISQHTNNTKIDDNVKENIQIFNITSLDNPVVIKLPQYQADKEVFSVAKHKSDKYLDISDFSASIVVLTQETYNPENDELEATTEDTTTTNNNLNNILILQEKAMKELRLTAYDLIHIVIPQTADNEVYDQDGKRSFLVDIAVPKTSAISSAETPLGRINIHNLIYGLTSNPSENICVGQCVGNDVTIQFEDSNKNLIVFEKPYSLRFKMYDVCLY